MYRFSYNGCDPRLLEFLASLHWRGDEEILPLLFSFSVADRRPIDELSKFYLEVFERQPVSIVRHLREVNGKVRDRVCQDMRQELVWHQRDQVSKQIRSAAPPSFDYVFARQCLGIE